MKMRGLCLSGVLFLVLSTVAMAQEHARLPHHLSQAPSKSAQITYHNGPVMVGNNHIYVIYYGKFTGSTTDIIDTFLENLGGSGAYGVNTTYYDGTGAKIINVANTSPVYYRASDSYYDAYSQGNNMKGNAIASEIQSVLQAGKLPADNNGLYLLVTSPDVKVSQSYCGYHTASTSMIPGYNIKYAFSPDPPPPTYNGCSGNYTTFGDVSSPNGDVGADSVADTLMHEISEMVTDPNLNAWYTSNGAENGDLCNFVYGTTYTSANGSHANHRFGTRDYLVQTIWANVGGGSCTLNYP